MRTMIALAAAAMLWTSPAMAEDWFLVGISSDSELAMLVDKDSIKDLGNNIRRARVYNVHRDAEADGMVAYDQVLDFDCSGTLRYRFFNIRSLGASGNVISDDVGSMKWRDIPEGSLSEAEQVFVCSNGDESPDAQSFGAANPIKTGRDALKSGSN